MRGNIPLMPKARSGHEAFRSMPEHWFARPRFFALIRPRRSAFSGILRVELTLPERRRRREYVLCDKPRIEARRKAKAAAKAAAEQNKD
jgi:hypothetical protein